MQYVTADGLPPVSKIGLGTMRFGEKTFDPGLARDLVRRALELGITHFDTAEAYGWGRSERLLGEALAAEGVTDAVVTSKYGPLLPLPAVIERHARASRGRLALPQIRLYLLHMPNPLFPRRVIMRGFGRAQEAGVIGAAGVSNHSLSQWQAAEAALGHPVAANEVLLNLLHRGPLDDLVPWAARHRRLVITASPLGQGMLAGRAHLIDAALADDGREAGQRVAGVGHPVAVVGVLGEVPAHQHRQLGRAEDAGRGRVPVRAPRAGRPGTVQDRNARLLE